MIFCILVAMKSLLQTIAVLIVAFALFACSDSSNEDDYRFERAVQDLSIFRGCSAKNDTNKYCYQMRWRIPIETDDLLQFHIWVDTIYVNDSTTKVPSGATEHSIKVPFENPEKLYDTLDLTSYVQEILQSESIDRDTLAIAIWSEYSDNDEPGDVQHVFIPLGDNFQPSLITISDSTWTTGVAIDWARPTDQTDYFTPESLSGPIAGYNVLLWAENTSQDIRNVKVTIFHDGKTDSTGKNFWKRHHRFRFTNDSLWIDETSSAESDKNYLRIAVIDGKGFDFANDSANRYRMIIEGLKPESNYTIGIIAWDSAGNPSGTGSVETNQLFSTTDSIAPLIGNQLWVRADTSDTTKAFLDSNRVLIYWSRSADPLSDTSGITADSILHYPNYCFEEFCYREVQSYIVELWNGSEWEKATKAGGESEEKYIKSYELDGDTMKVSATGAYVVDTIRWVVPGDTLIVRVRAIDSSGYYSKALIDTIYVTLGPEADLNCPAGFVPVRTSDTTRFCIEKFEHQNSDSTFAHNVLFAEAQAACESISASGFSVSLCKSADWKAACTAQGKTSYGVIEESDFSASEYLYKNCEVGSDDSTNALDISKRNKLCVSPDGVRNFAGGFQEWVLGSSDTMLYVLRGSSYIYYSGESRESLSKCTTYFIPHRTRAGYTQDTVYLYREGSKVDTSYTQDTTRTLYKMLTKKDFTDSVQFFKVSNADGDSLGEDYAPLSEYKNGGESWLKELAGNLIYEPIRTEAVFFTGEAVAYKGAAAFYTDASISFRCCAYPED